MNQALMTGISLLVAAVLTWFAVDLAMYLTRPNVEFFVP